MKLIWTLLTVAMFLGACRGLEARKEVDVHVYCQQEKHKTELLLYVNDTFRGNIPFSPEKYTCDNPAPENGSLNLTLLPGTYPVTVTDKTQQVISKGTLILTEDNMELVGQAGGMDARQQERCLYLEIL